MGSNAIEAIDRPLRDSRVLVVEDSTEARNMIARMLRLAGAEVDTAESARAALARVVAFAPDIIVTDLAMPDDSGYDLLRACRAPTDRGGLGLRLPMIALSGFAGPEESALSRSVGFQAHIEKPVDFFELVATVHQLLPCAPAVLPS